MKKVVVYIIAILLYPLLSAAQNFNYVHYDTKDGLAGATVYNSCQDTDGFIWFATENGVSRYDGGKFKNFTVKDGLPDNEVLKVFSDSKGRTWIGTFNKQLCYYYKGKIYTQQNDSLLKKITLNGFFRSAVEAEDGTIALSDGYKIIIFPPATQDVVFLSIPETISLHNFTACNGTKILANNDLHDSYLYNPVTRKFEYFISTPKNIVLETARKNGLHIVYQSCDGKQYTMLQQKPGYINALSKNNKTLFLNTTNGSWEVDTVNLKWGNHFLPGKHINSTLIDSENNKWFCTTGEGVYKLPSAFTKTTQIISSGTEKNTEVFTLLKFNKSLMAGLNMGKVAVFNDKNFTNTVDYTYKDLATFRFGVNRLYSVKAINDTVAVLGFDYYLVKLNKGKPLYNYIFPVKSVEKINNEYILVGTSSVAVKIRLADLQITDTIWRERCTKVFYSNNRYYIGTLNGLYEINEDKTYVYLGNIHPALTRRITDIKATADNTLWIATADMGLVAYKNNKITAYITDSNGLSSNICKTLFLQKNYLWAGTNKGINKIDIADKNHFILKYSIADGLASDLVNAIYTEDSIVYVGTPAGLTWFNENKISSASVCKLVMLDITSAGLPVNSVNNTLSYKNPGIHFEYVGVSVKSAGEIDYYYRLKGLNENWNQTTQAVLDFQALAPGNYELELYAVNKFAQKSNTERFAFYVSAPFWKTQWFFALAIISAIVITGLAVNILNKKYRRRLQEKNMQQKQFAALEQQALQAQMNPHFIFNCLNGIQQYILTGNKEKANEYLTGFSRLIRQTLDNSGKKTITVAEEANYLTEYLEMEKMRAGGNFNYVISINKNTEAASMEMSAMLLQPYVENALRHGLRYLKDKTGKVEIFFSKENNTLLCTVKDNGIGRKYAEELKSNQHIEYQSKGMSLTARRMDLLNKINDAKMTVVINDLYDTTGLAIGTEVIIQIPII